MTAPDASGGPVVPPETVWAEEGGRRVTVENCGGTVRLTITDVRDGTGRADDHSVTATIAHYRWVRLAAAASPRHPELDEGARPPEGAGKSIGWGRDMFIAGATAGVTPARKKKPPLRGNPFLHAEDCGSHNGDECTCGSFA